MRYGLTLNGALLVVQSEDDLYFMLKLIDWRVYREDIVTSEEHYFQEGPELDCHVMDCVLGVFIGTKAEVETQLYQVSDMPGFGVGVGGFRGHDGVDDAQGGGIFLLDWGGL